MHQVSSSSLDQLDSQLGEDVNSLSLRQLGNVGFLGSSLKDAERERPLPLRLLRKDEPEPSLRGNWLLNPALRGNEYQARGKGLTLNIYSPG